MQGCVLSQDLFNLYCQTILQELVEMPGFKIDRKTINNPR